MAACTHGFRWQKLVKLTATRGGPSDEAWVYGCVYHPGTVLFAPSDGLPPFFVAECGAAAAQYHPPSPRAWKQSGWFGFKGWTLELEPEQRSATCVKSVCLDNGGRAISFWHNFSALAGRTEEQMFSCLCGRALLFLRSDLHTNTRRMKNKVSANLPFFKKKFKIQNSKFNMLPRHPSQHCCRK